MTIKKRKITSGIIIIIANIIAVLTFASNYLSLKKENDDLKKEKAELKSQVQNFKENENYYEKFIAEMIKARKHVPKEFEDVFIKQDIIKINKAIDITGKHLKMAWEAFNDEDYHGAIHFCPAKPELRLTV